MTREDIIRMAREAGLKFREHLDEFFSPLCDGVYFEDLEDFANLVAAAEREACAKVCDELVTHTRALGDNDSMLAAISCAIAIRERGAP